MAIGGIINPAMEMVNQGVMDVQGNVHIVESQVRQINDALVVVTVITVIVIVKRQTTNTIKTMSARLWLRQMRWRG